MNAPGDDRLPIGAGDTTTSTYGTTHSANCWRWHHLCGVARIEALASALREAVDQFNTAVAVRDQAYLAALPVPAERVDRWRQVLQDVAGADVTPRPSPPATTGT